MKLFIILPFFLCGFPTLSSGVLVLQDSLENRASATRKDRATVTSTDFCESECDKPLIMFMKYIGKDAVRNHQGGDKSYVEGSVSGATRVQIVASGKEDGTGDIYFQGQVESGQLFAIDGRDKSKLNPNIYINIKDEKGSYLQRIQLHTTCSVPIVLGDSFGAVMLVGVKDKNDCSKGETTEALSFDTSPVSNICGGECDKPVAIFMKYTGDHSIANHQGDNSFVTGLANDYGAVQIIASSKEDGDGDIYFQGRVETNQVFAIDGSVRGELNSNTFITIKDTKGSHLQTVQIDTSCTVPIALEDSFGAIVLVGFKGKNGCRKGDTPDIVSESESSSGDRSDGNLLKPIVMFMKFSTDRHEVWAKDYGTVQIIVNSKEDGTGHKYFQGQVETDQIFVIDGREQGKLNSEIYFIIKDTNGIHLRTVQYNMSCSEINVLENFAELKDKDYEGDSETSASLSIDETPESDICLGDCGLGEGGYGEVNFAELNDKDYGGDGETPASHSIDEAPESDLCKSDCDLGEWGYGEVNFSKLNDKDYGGDSETPASLSIDEPTVSDICESDCGKPIVIIMKYTGKDNVNNHQGDASFVSGVVDEAARVQIVASSNEDGTGDVYFRGHVPIAEMFVIDGIDEGGLSSNTYINIKDAKGTHLQMVQISTSCSVPIVLGDSFGGIEMVGTIDKDGCRAGKTLGISLQNSSEGDDVCADDCDKPVVLYMRYTGNDIVENAQGSSSVTGVVNGAMTVQIVASSKEDGTGDIYFEGQVLAGSMFAVDGRHQGGLNPDTYLIIKDNSSGNQLQMVKIQTSCVVPIVLGDHFGSVDLSGYKDQNGCGAR